MSRQGDTFGGAARSPWTILVLLAVAQFMVILDITVVNVALPSIGRDLGFARGDLQWVVTAYVLFTGGLLLLDGRMADLLGRRRVFLSGLTLFTAASFASGLAVSPGAPIVSRAAQGLGAAMLSPAALSIITATYTGEQRTTALSAWGAIAAGGAAAGVLFGGVITTCLSWQWIFFINVPIGVATVILALRLVPNHRASAGFVRELDLAGALCLVGGLVVLVYAIEGTTTRGWGSARTLLLLALSAGLLTAFATLERRVLRPLVPPATWHAVACRKRRGDARRYGHPGRHLLPRLAVPPRRDRRFGPGDRSRLPAARGHDRNRGTRRSSSAHARGGEGSRRGGTRARR
jgi:MFS family permease